MPLKDKDVRKSCLVLFSVLFVSIQTYARDWILKDQLIQVTFDDNTGSLKIWDKRCNKTWQQQPYSALYKAGQVVQKGNSLSVRFSGATSFGVTFTLTTSSSLEIVVTGDTSMDMGELEFPSSFKTPDKNHYLLYTDGGGFLLPANDQEYPAGNGVTYFCGGGLSMAWMGVTDTAFKTGYMAILETPYDAALRPKREDGLVTFSPVWLASMGKFGYSRKVTYHFFDKGGYVAQCKKYREYIWKKNSVMTLKENEKKTPAIAKMIGGIHLYVWDNARDISFAKDLKQSGIDKALILWDANHSPYPEKDYDSRLKELGYATGAYELFTDLKYKDTSMYEADLAGPFRFGRTTYPGLFHTLAARKKDGKTYFNQFGHTICPATIQPEMTKRIDRELKEYPHETYFLDVYQANGLFECYNPQHPLTRQQFAEQVIKNYAFIRDKYNQFTGGEWGADYTGSTSVYVHGMMTLQRTWFGSDITKRGTIYHYGDWRSNARPSQMLSTRVAPDKYLKYSINEYTRVPLYELVYHDAIVTSWRWEDGNHHNPEIWWKKDLFNILYGSAPLWNLDREHWEMYKNTFIKSYNDVCPWLQKIGYDEMVSHRFVSGDHKVQETVFSSGKKAIVNFGDSEVFYEGNAIKPKAFITLAHTASNLSIPSSGLNSWQNLFNGKGTGKLHGYNMERFPNEAWRIENGALVAIAGVPNIDLVTEESYKNFELELEWKVAVGGNGGVFFHVQENRTPQPGNGNSANWLDNFEMQILDDINFYDKEPKRSAGSLYDLIAPVNKKLKQVGEYNNARLVVKDGHVEHWLNGSKTVEYDIDSEKLNDLISKSKFNRNPQFGKSKEGKLMFQHHGQQVWLKNIRIRPL